MKTYLYPSNILLPDFNKIDGKKWAAVACDQYTSEPGYWEKAYDFVGNSPSTLELMLPEAFLDKESELIPKINQKMREYLANHLVEHKNSMIYLERKQSDGRVRKGIVGAIDLEEYDYSKGSETLTRATEGTVLERIPPRVAIRRGAAFEMPHIMILIDDPDRTVVEPIAANTESYAKAYDFDLMADSGHVKGYFISPEDFDGINTALAELATSEAMKQKYGVEAAPLIFAMGDGNHSLASAKALYEEIKGEIGEEAAKDHPARYALCEIVNLHDEALDFEPIYRVLFGVDKEDFAISFADYLSALHGNAEEQAIDLWQDGEIIKTYTVKSAEAQLTVGTVQNFLDIYVKAHPEVTVDYIHGIETVRALTKQENTLGITFDGMTKNMLFKTVICDGALPRKTFSMGHAADKRFYLECRKIR
ncbi:MAG: DUF1015 domain-containing protein [Ruminococcaceae bacterium]|nr:DUF1015 domain-containing protein [Oscillospiraceae bacterium]